MLWISPILSEATRPCSGLRCYHLNRLGWLATLHPHCLLGLLVMYTVLYYTILYYTILYYNILYYTILYYTILYCTVLYYTILYYTILYYTMCYLVWQVGLIAVLPSERGRERRKVCSPEERPKRLRSICRMEW